MSRCPAKCVAQCRLSRAWAKQRHLRANCRVSLSSALAVLASRAVIKSMVKSVVGRLGLTEPALFVLQVTSQAGRRNLRDDRQMAIFMADSLSRDANCIDIGAHKGSVLRKILKVAPDGQHMAFEPIPQLAEQLTREFPAVDVRGVALSDETGEMTFHVADSPQLSGLRRREWLDIGWADTMVPVCRLDDLVPAGMRVDFLKIDVEGAEVRTLLGARRILADQHPAIWFEHGARAPALYDTTTADLWHLLTENGYRVWTADGEGPLDVAGMQKAHAKPMWSWRATSTE